MRINSNMQISLMNTSTAYKDVNCRCALGNHAMEDMLLHVDGRQQGKKKASIAGKNPVETLSRYVCPITDGLLAAGK